MANVYDAIIIGGGHNGLTSGAYFARAGARTVVLEARGKTGGAADTSAPFPDHPEIKVTTYSYVMSLMPPTIIRELNLKQHGYDVTPFGPYYQAFPDGRAITVYADDAEKSYDSIAQFSKKDAETLPKWEAWLKGVADVLGPLLLQMPPKLGSLAIGDLIESAQSAWKMRKLGVARRRRRDPSVHDERDATCSTTGSSPTRSRAMLDRERGHRHVGGSGRAGHRVRDAPPLDRRRRRRAPRLVGLPAGRDGRRLRFDPSLGGVLRRRDPHRRPREADPRRAAAVRSASRSRTARSSARRSA